MVSSEMVSWAIKRLSKEFGNNFSITLENKKNPPIIRVENRKTCYSITVNKLASLLDTKTVKEIAEIMRKNCETKTDNIIDGILEKIRLTIVPLSERTDNFAGQEILNLKAAITMETSTSSGNQTTFFLTYDDLLYYGISPEEAYTTALTNTLRHNYIHITDGSPVNYTSDILKELKNIRLSLVYELKYKEPEKAPLVMLQSRIFSLISEKIKRNLVIILTAEHLFCFPVNELTKEAIAKYTTKLHEINASSPQNYLTNKIYYYNMINNELSVID